MGQRILALIAITIVCTAIARAETITFAYEGIVDTFVPDTAPIAAWLGYTPIAGDPFQMVYSFSSNAPDLLPDDPFFSSYSLDSISFSIGPATIPLSPGGVAVGLDFFLPDLSLYRDDYTANGMTCDEGSNACLGVWLYMRKDSASPGGGPFTSDALPLIQPSPADFDHAHLYVEVCPILGGDCLGTIYAHSVTVAPVPIPAVGWLLAPAFAVLARRRVARY